MGFKLNKKTHDFQEYNGILFNRLKNNNEYFDNKDVSNMHRYVWTTFMENDVPEGCVIHHVDRDKSNNDISNLVCMEKEEHSRWHSSNISKETSLKRSLSLSKKVKCIETNIEYISIKEAIKQTTISHISHVCHGHRKTAGGYHWEYV